MVDMTGGVGQRIELEDARKSPESQRESCSDIQDAFKCGSLMSASIQVGIIDIIH